MIIALTAQQMNYRKRFLIQERDRLFDEYLDTLDKIEVWKKKVNYESDFHAKKSNKELVEVMKDTLRKISIKLTYYDYAISTPEQAEIYYSILEIY
jgi:hypothetical protein